VHVRLHFLQCYRRLLLSSFLIVISNYGGSENATAFALYICLLSIKLYGYYSPFEEVEDDMVAECAQWQFLLIVLSMILIPYLGNLEAFDIFLMVIANVGLALIFIIFVAKILQKYRKGRRTAKIESDGVSADPEKPSLKTAGLDPTPADGEYFPEFTMNENIEMFENPIRNRAH